MQRMIRPNVCAALIVLLSLIGLYLGAPVTKPLNCDMECGETLLSLRAAQQFRENGIEHGLLENLGTHEHPSIYTHNVNIGTLTFVALEALGVADKYKFLLPLLIYGLGLAYVYLTVRRISGNEYLALVTLLAFATTYWGLGAYALNALRAWHLFAFFAVIFHSYGLARLSQGGKETVGLCIGTIAAFGCGYDFWIICGAVSLSIVLANLDTYSLRRIALAFATLALAFALPFALRQVQVIWAMGASFWAQDLIYSVAIKVPYASDFIRIPSLEQIDAYYRARNVLRPPAQLSNDAAQIYATFRHMLKFVTVPRWGMLSLWILAGAVAVAATAWVRRTQLSAYCAALILPATLGTTIGLVIFAPFSLHVYFKHEFPLAPFLLLLAKGAAFYFLIAATLAAQRSWRARVAVSLLAAVLIVDTVMVHWNNSKYGPALNFAWGKVFAEHPDEKVALSVYRLMPVADPYIGIDSARAVYVSPKEMHVGDRPELKYWVYQPHERFVDFDSAVPLCNWTSWFRQIQGKRRVPTPGQSCIYGHPVPANAVPEPSVTDIIKAAAARYSVAEEDASTNGYVILKRR